MRKLRSVLRSDLDRGRIGDMDRAIDKLVRWDVPLPRYWNESEPWQRQPCDEDSTWHAFRSYLRLSHPRTLDRVARETRIPLATLKRWAKNLAWELRASAWDNYIHETWQTQVEAQVLESADSYVERHGRILERATKLVELELDKYLSVSEATDTIGLLRPADLTALMKVAIQLDRLHHGDTTEQVDVRWDLSQMNVIELKQLKRLQGKAKKADD